jgi:hypothetical protein
MTSAFDAAEPIPRRGQSVLTAVRSARLGKQNPAALTHTATLTGQDHSEEMIGFSTPRVRRGTPCWCADAPLDAAGRSHPPRHGIPAY